jgi:outer membrane protein assembly factor BamB
LSSPAVANGVVYIGSDDGNVHALNARTGVRLWSYLTGSGANSPTAVADGTVYIGSSDYNVYAFSLEQGSKEATSAKRPALQALRPDLSLKVAVPIAAVLRPD